MRIDQNSLSLKQQMDSRKRLLLFSFINGISFILISGNILTLFLLKSGFPPYLVAIVGSFVYLASLFTIFTKILICKYGAVSTMVFSWFMRSLFVLLLSVIPFLDVKLNHYSCVVLIFVVSLLYFIFRAFGQPAMQPVFNEITTEDNSGKFASDYFLFFSIAMLITMIASLFILSVFDSSLIIFQLLIMAGAITGFVCSFLLISVKESPLPSISAADIKLRLVFKEIFNVDEYKRFFFIRAYGFAVCTVVISVSIIALVKMYDITYSYAIIFAIFQLCGGIAISFLSGLLIQYTGSKPLLIIHMAILSIVSLMWVFAPVHFNFTYIAVIFLLCGFVSRGLSACMLHYFLSLIPSEKNVSFSIAFSTFTGLVTGLAGFVLSGGVLFLLQSLSLHASEKYRLYYLIMFFAILPIFILFRKLQKVKSWKVNNVIGLIFTPRDMYALYFLSKMQKFMPPTEEVHNIEALENMKSDLAESKILYYLDSPSYLIRLRALKQLRKVHFTSEAKNKVLNELKKGEFFTAHIAASLAGEHEIYEAMPILRSYLHTEDYQLLGNSMIALVLLKDHESYDEIIRIFIDAVYPKIVIAGVAALFHMENKSVIKVMLNKCNDYNSPLISVTEELLLRTSRKIILSDKFYMFLRIYNESSEKAFLTLKEELKEFDDSNESKKIIKLESLVFDFIDNKISDLEFTKILLNLKNSAVRVLPDDFYSFFENTTKINKKLMFYLAIYLMFIK